MINYMIGKVLQNRYQVVQTLGAGVFGQTFIAIDMEQPNNPKCVIKQLKVFSYQSNYLENLRLRFLSETQTLNNLGQHQQIPQLLSCFEENERFYLVQELIEGNPLTGELPINSNMDSIYLWTENEVVRFLQDILNVLDFIHSQGVIHCDIKPDNLIRRAYDGRLFLIDFGSIQPVDFGTDVVLPIYQMPVTSLGYIPPEQFIGQTKPNSDIYALGIIAIQALTGLTPLNFQVDPYTNEIIWRSHHTPVSDYLAAILSQMIRYDYTHRFQSAAQVLNALQEMPLEQWEPKNTIHTDYIVLPESTEDIRFPPEYNNDSSSSTKPVKSSSLLTGMKVGLIANSIFLGFGAYSLINNYPAYSGKGTLHNATEKYQSGDFKQAISLVKSIPPTSNIYPDAKATAEEWQAQWQIAAEKFSLVTQAFNNAQWSEVLRVAPEVPDILYWRSKTDKLVERAQNNIETQTQDLLNQAYAKARDRDFTMALHYLKQIPGESPVGALVKEKITEYEQKQRTRAVYLLQQAYNQAATSNFDNAIKSLKQIPKNTPSYKTAQLKLREYIHKQRIQASVKNTGLSSSKNQVLLDNSSVNGQQVKFNSSLKNVSHTSLENLAPERNLQEMNIH